MNWAEIATIVGAAGSLAVVISLIYLAIQIRIQVKECRVVVVNSLTQQWGEAVQAFALHGDLYQIWMRGLADFKSLSPEERGRLSAISAPLALEAISGPR